MTTGTATVTATLLDDLQDTLAHGSVARRVETLRRVTDLFMGHCVEYTDDQIAVFDDVFTCLIQEMKRSALTLLAHRLAPVPSAPPRTIHALAFNDLIDVAAPPLSYSERLDDGMLIENARSKSQAHLLAISVRRRISPSVTDVLMTRGNDAVVQSTANNPGASFSEDGFAILVDRAEHNDAIANCAVLREDIPRHHYLKLVARASDAVRTSLKTTHPQVRDHVSAAVGEVTRRARSAKQAILPQTEIAHALVKSLYVDGRIDEVMVAAFADEGKFDEANAAIACLAQVSVDLAETIMIEARIEGIFILAKVSHLSWSTVQSIIAMRAKLSEFVPTETEEHRNAYARLRLSTAHQVLRFHRMQQSAAVT